MDHTQRAHATERHSSRGKWVLVGFLAVAAFFLWTEHRAHLLGVFPYLLLLACPLMHLFHHGCGHRHRETSGAPGTNNPKKVQSDLEQNP